MAQASALRWMFPTVVVGLALWWWLQSRSPEPEPAVAPMVAESAQATGPAVTRSPVGESAQRVIPGGFDLPPVAAATPAEVESLRDAEVERSAASPLPPRRFTGPDGKPREFAYAGSDDERAREQARADRRSLLMARLRADPRGFGREHRLSAKEVQWILDGSNDFPDRLLD